MDTYRYHLVFSFFFQLLSLPFCGPSYGSRGRSGDVGVRTYPLVTRANPDVSHLALKGKCPTTMAIKAKALSKLPMPFSQGGRQFEDRMSDHYGHPLRTRNQYTEKAHKTGRVVEIIASTGTILTRKDESSGGPLSSSS